MADDVENDDQWLYGDNPDGNPPEPEQQTEPSEASEATETPVQEKAPAPIEPSPINYPEVSTPYTMSYMHSILGNYHK